MKNLLIATFLIGLFYSCSSNEQSNLEVPEIENVKNGLTLEQRKEIHSVIAAMEKKAQIEADKKFDVVNNVTEESMKQNVAENTRLKEEGQTKIMKEYKINDKTYWDIATEGTMNEW